jgi:opacity protein-like surface antigen
MLCAMRTRSSAFSLLVLVGSALPFLALAQATVAPPPAFPPPPGQPKPAPAQQPGRIELNAFGGWITSSDVDLGGGTLKIGDASSWGASIGMRTPHGTKVELKWIYFDPEVKISSTTNSNTFHVPTNYFLIGGEKGIRRGKVEPFFGGSLGAVVYSPGSFDFRGVHYSPSTTWRMGFGLGGGLKVFVAEKFALRLGAEMLFPVYFNGGSMYVGTGGSGLAVSGGIPTVSGNFTIGVTVAP